MAKAEINNEIVLLRHAVRQARVCVVNKLVKEAKVLRNKRGNETQQEKYKRKADKLVAEVYALKMIKDDDISKFGITDERDLIEILEDQSLSNSDRVTARVAHYKTFHRRLMQLKEKFPDCKKLLTERRKKKTIKLKDKDIAKDTKKSLKRNNPPAQDKSLKKQRINSDENIVHSQNNSKNEEVCNSELPEASNNLCKRKKLSNNDSALLERQKLLKLGQDGTLEDRVLSKQSNIIKPYSVTKEATVKRFIEFLEEQGGNQDAQTSVENSDSIGTETEQAKIIDDFFIMEDGKNYQEINTGASTSYTRPHKYNTETKTFQFGDRNKKQNTKYKNNSNFSKKYLNERSTAMKPKKMAFNKIDKSENKNNFNVNNKEEKVSLHPSWLAKKKEQEIMSQGFQGKKIVFTDD